MPIYEYETISGGCDKCRSPFEVFQKRAEQPLERCPHCGGAVRRVPARCSGVRFKVSYSDAKKAGFTILERRDKGVYERM